MTTELPSPAPYGRHRVPQEVTATPPRRVPRVGVVLRLEADQWRYTNEPRPLRALVTVVRPDVSLYYGGDWVWVRAVEVAADGRVPGEEQAVLVHVDAVTPGDAGE